MEMSKEVEYHRGHVLVIPYPSQGHINPLLQFAKRLASKGLKATLATTYYTIKSIHVSGVGVEPISDGFDESGYAQVSNEEAYLESFKTVGSVTLSELIQKFESSDSPVNCIVYDSFLIWALDVAKQHGIYAAAFFTNSATVCSIFSHIHHGLLELPVKVGGLIDGLPPLSYSDLPMLARSPEAYPAYFRMNVNQHSNLQLVDWIFCNTFDELEGKEAKSASELWPGKLIGPMIPSFYLDGRIEDDKGYGASLWKPLSDECMQWVNSKSHASVIYVSFGSMVALSIVQMEEIAWGLKNCGRHFLWVVKDSERNKLSNSYAFIQSIQEKGLIVSWCNQLEVLAHNSIGCFVTHCGWNSTMEGLSLGVPMVGVAKWADQSTNAKFIEDIWQVGVRAKDDEKGVVGREELEKCVREVMEGRRSEEIKKNAKKWRELAKEAISEGGSSDKKIDEFVDAFKSGKKEDDEKINT
ncbi:Udp-glycosyltransferase 74b1 [Thalictrum thalictroides]|uniref:Glycosyltransferase n=1 Tax=Thalictrum thalictroides TaxID=46969 RepID=A0A7J6X4R5_THATH|nr:Udp-glycosyltransferase 74b1 [Thalictrum thalictroides]